MKILILTGKFGLGHWSASQSLRQQLMHDLPDAEVRVEDMLSYALPKLSEVMYKGFDLMVSHGSLLFNLYYGHTSQGSPDAKPPFEELFLDKLAELLEGERPDVVIATHPLCAQLISQLKSRYALDLPLITCITDISSHPEWINRYTDCYLVPDGKVLDGLTEKGVDPAAVCVTGIPVREEFRRLSPGSGKNGKERRRELLIMGGGLGLLPRSQAFYQALNSLPDTHTTIITGHNRRAYERLRGRWEHIEVLGFTARVWEYMSKADLIVSKPGGITLFEAIYAQVPILTWPPSLAQECSNADWLAAKGIGWVAEKGETAEDIRILLQDRRRLSEASRRMGQLKKRMRTEQLSGLLGAVAAG